MTTITLPPLPTAQRARIFDGMASVYSPADLRARDIEVVRFVLEAAANRMILNRRPWCHQIANELRALEFTHHD